MPNTLNIPEADRRVFGLFAAAVVDACRGDADKLVDTLGRVFALLLGNIQDVKTMMAVLENKPADVATTVLAYLDPTVQGFVVAELNKRPELKNQIEKFIADYQRAALAEIWRRASAGEKQALAYQKLRAAA